MCQTSKNYGFRHIFTDLLNKEMDADKPQLTYTIQLSATLSKTQLPNWLKDKDSFFST